MISPITNVRVAAIRSHQIGDHRAGERGDPGDRERLEAVEHTPLHVLA
jgi:hypothetical protein